MIIPRSEAGRDIANIRRKLFFGGSIFRSVHAETRERGTRPSGRPAKIQRATFASISYVFAPNYGAVIMVITVRVSHRLLILVACINPIFMIANGATLPVTALLLLLLLQPSLLGCCCCCCWCCGSIAARCSANGRNNSRIKNRKIENETASCRVTVRLNAETRTGGE